MLYLTGLTAQADYSDIAEYEKIGVSLGYGSEFSNFGIKASYGLNKSFFLIGGGTLLGLGFDIVAKAGIEFRATSLFKTSSIVPYFNAQFGISENPRLTCNSTWENTGNNCFNTQEWISESKVFMGPTLGIGIKYKLIKRLRGYGSIGVNYNYAQSSKINQFVSEFNELYQADYTEFLDSGISFAVGYTYVFKSSDPDYKR